VSETRTFKIAVAQALSGQTRVCGPDDVGEYDSEMEAAICWLLEAGETPSNRYWITVQLPAPNITEIDLDAEFGDVDGAQP